MFINDETTPALTGKDFDDLMDFLEDHRVLKFEDQISSILKDGAITLNDLRGQSRNRSISAFLQRLGEDMK
jgi:hypothetical protein